MQNCTCSIANFKSFYVFTLEKVVSISIRTRRTHGIIKESTIITIAKCYHVAFIDNRLGFQQYTDGTLHPATIPTQPCPTRLDETSEADESKDLGQKKGCKILNFVTCIQQNPLVKSLCATLVYVYKLRNTRLTSAQHIIDFAHLS